MVPWNVRMRSELLNLASVRQTICHATWKAVRGSEMSKTFSQYLSDWPMTDTPQSDFVRDAGKDRRLTESTSWAELEAHMFSRGADRPQIKAAKAVWRGYVNQRDRRAARPSSSS